MARQLIVELLANTDKFKGGLDKATKQTETFGQKARKAARVAGPAFAAVGGALTALSGPLDQSNAQLEVMVGNSEKISQTDVAGWADDNRRAFQLSGISIAEQNIALSEAIGLGEDWDTTARIMSVANDLAAATGISLKEAVAQIGRASDGSGKLIDKFGLEVEDIDGLLAALDDRVGGVSAEIDKTFTGRIKGATTVVKDWGAQIGVVAGPILTGLGGALFILPPLINAVKVAIHGMNAALRATAGVLRGHPIFLVATAMVAIAEVSERVTGGFDGVRSSLFNLKDQVRQIRDRFRDLWRNIKGVGDALANLPGVGAIGGLLGKVFHAGGTVPGRPGQTVPILAQAGETVVPRGGTGGGITIHVSGVGMGRDFGQAIADALRDNGLVGVT